MKRVVIFNVGGALSSYLEFDDNKVIIDLGKSDEFNPVLDFLLPLAEARLSKSQHNQEKYHIEQAFLSHLDNDHISAIHEFDEHFHPELLTVPCEHPKQNNLFNIINIKSLFTDENKNRDKVLELMEPGRRSPGYGREIQEDFDKPLVVHPNYINEIQLYHIPASICGTNDNLKEQHSNNMSLVLFININGHTLLIPGDITDEGVEYLIDHNDDLLQNLQTLGIDFLVAPHHGLETSFPESLFRVVRGGKVKRLNIISEKRRPLLSLVNRSDVDERYYSDDYCLGDNSLNQRGVKTSKGHIVIDLSGDTPIVERVETENLLAKFV